MSTIIRLFINFLLSGLLILIFRSLGWIEILSPPEFSPDVYANDVITAGIIGLVLFIVGELLGVAYKVIKKVFFIFGCVIAFIYFFISGYLKLWIAAMILMDWFDYTKELLPVIIISFFIGFVRWPDFGEVDEEMKEFRKWKKDQRRSKRQ